jgi:hypothetical protein
MLKIMVDRQNEKSVKVHLINSGVGALIEDFTIDRWIEEGINELHKYKDVPFYFTQSGNTIVLITRADDDNNGMESYSVTVSTPRQWAEVRLED